MKGSGVLPIRLLVEFLLTRNYTGLHLIMLMIDETMGNAMIDELDDTKEITITGRKNKYYFNTRNAREFFNKKFIGFEG